MKIVCVLVVLINIANGYYYNNNNTASNWQLEEFRDRNPMPIGCLTTTAGEPVDVRDTVAINTDFLNKQAYLDANTHMNKERIPERLVHAKGMAAYGYFEVLNDVSKYTKADVFNVVGKRTRVVLRFSTNRPKLGGTEFGREFKGLGIKFYTKEGNLDFTCLQTPMFIYKSPVDFASSTHSVKPNPTTNTIEDTMQWDFTSLKPDRLLAFLWLYGDNGIPKNFRTMDQFPIHTYEVNNKYGETYYVKFNFITEQGLQSWTSAEAFAVASEDPDHYTRDLYNALARKEYPSWRLDMDILSVDDIKKLDFDPFDITRLWKNGTYQTVTVGRVVVTKRATNHFKDSEQSAYNPANLVPGIAGPHDFVFKGRKLFYRDAQNSRLGINHNELTVNRPLYQKTYNRDGVAPLVNNMRDAPNYFPNSFNGPIPFVDEVRPKRLLVLTSNAVDFENIRDFYDNIIYDDAHKQRLADNVAASLEISLPEIAERVIKMLTLAHPDLGKRVLRSVQRLKEISKKQTTAQRYKQIAQCLESNMANGLR